MSDYKLKTGQVGEAVKKIEDTVVGGYKKIEDAFSDKFLNEDGSLKTGKAGEAVVDGYKKIEDGVVSGYKKIEGAFVETFLEKVDDNADENK